MKLKRTISVICLTAIVAVTIFAFVGCSQLSVDEGYETLRDALSNTLHEDNAHIFYWKESISTPRAGLSNNVVSRKVNVLCDIDDDYDFIKNSSEEYDYSGLKVMVTESENDTVNKEIYCGYADDGKTYLSEWDSSMGTNGSQKKYKVTAGVTAKEYVLSDAFKPYTLDTILTELKGIAKEDLVFDGVSNSGVQKKGHVVTITCKMSDEYLARYEATNGKKSLLDGKYVTFEVCYDRISSIIVYQQEEGGGLFTLEYESYKLEIVYMGPKFTVQK